MSERITMQKMYIDALKQLYTFGYLVEKWLDNNSHRLSFKVKSIQEAKFEINNLMKGEE